MISLSYGNGRTVRVPKGLSVLEASLRNNVPHASVCGGRARCSTCRIRVIGDCSALPEPSQREAFVLGRVGADRSVDPARLPVAADRRPLLLPALHAAHDVGQRACVESGADRPGALSRQHVRRHARLDPACRKAAAVRHRLHRQPLPRRGVAGRDRMRRPAEPVRRRRHAGAVRARQQPPGPPAARRCKAAAHDRRQCRRAEPIPRATICASRSASASAFTAAR